MNKLVDSILDTRPLSYATTIGLAQALIQKGAKVNFSSFSGETLLHKAAWGDSEPAVMKLFIQEGLDANQGNNLGFGPLHLLALNCSGVGNNATSIVKKAEILIFDGGAKITPIERRDGQTPIDIAQDGCNFWKSTDEDAKKYAIPCQRLVEMLQTVKMYQDRGIETKRSEWPR